MQHNGVVNNVASILILGARRVAPGDPLSQGHAHFTLFLS